MDVLYDVADITRVHHRASGEVHALRGVSLQVAAGDRLGIVGESGSGKSSLLRIMAALDQPTSGRVLFRGEEVSGRGDRELAGLRSSVQMVFQDPRSSLDPRMRVGRTITEALRSPVLRGARAGGSPVGDTAGRPVPPDTPERLHEVMRAVGLDPSLAERYPHEFSGGQRQRIAIARALAPDPDVLLADEPVSALDVSVRAQVLNLLRDLVAERALTLVFVSHDLDVVRHVCDRVVVMQHGEVVEHGSIEQVYQDPQQEYTKALLAAVPRIRL